MSERVKTWFEVVSAVEQMASYSAHNAWASPLLTFTRHVAASKYSRVFFPNVSVLLRQLYLVQTKEYEIRRNVLCIQADHNDEFEFTYQDSGVKEHWWRRRCPQENAFAVFESAVDHLHLLVRYE